MCMFGLVFSQRRSLKSNKILTHLNVLKRFDINAQEELNSGWKRFRFVGHAEFFDFQTR
jgi:hypothetical protein